MPEFSQKKKSADHDDNAEYDDVEDEPDEPNFREFDNLFDDTVIILIFHLIKYNFYLLLSIIVTDSIK